MQLTVRDAAKYLEVPEHTLYRWIDAGDVPVIRIKDQYRLNSADLLEWSMARGLQVSVEVIAGSDPGSRPGLASALAVGGVQRFDGPPFRDSVLTAIVAGLHLPDVRERALLLDMVRAREALCSTGVGEGLAIPHVRSPVVMHGAPATLALWHLGAPVDFAAPDARPVDTVFFLVSPSPRVHLRLLSQLSSALHDEAFRNAVKQRAPLEELLAEARRVDAQVAARGEELAP